MAVSWFIYPPVVRHLGCFQVFFFDMKMLYKLCAGFCVDIRFFSLGEIRLSRIAGSYDKSIFNFIKNGQSVLQSGCTILYSYSQCQRVPVVPDPY